MEFPGQHGSLKRTIYLDTIPPASLHILKESRVKAINANLSAIEPHSQGVKAILFDHLPLTARAGLLKQISVAAGQAAIAATTVHIDLSW